MPRRKNHKKGTKKQKNFKKISIKSKKNRKTRKYRGGQNLDMYPQSFLTNVSPVGISPFHNLY
jgi:hypothetical protein